MITSDKLNKKRVVFLVVVVFLVLLYYFLTTYFSKSELTTEKQSDKIYIVVRKDFNNTISLKGTLNAVKNYEIESQLPNQYPAVLVEVVENYKHVKKGEVVVKLFSQPLVDMTKKEQQNLLSSKDVVKQRKREVIKKKKGYLKEVQQAIDGFRKANTEYTDYIDTIAKKELTTKRESVFKLKESFDNLQNQINTKKTALIESNDEKQSDTISLEINKLESNLKDTLERLNAANAEIKKFHKDIYTQKVFNLKQKINQASKNIFVVIESVKRKEKYDEGQITSAKFQVEQVQQRIEALQRYRQFLEIKAPASGIFTYGNVQTGGGAGVNLKVGSKIYTRQKIAYIPDTSGYVVKLNLPEVLRSKIFKGMATLLHLPAIGDFKESGKISHIATIATNEPEWDKTAPKVYKIEVFTETKDKRLTPGMSVEAELVIKKLKDVLLVPIEAVFFEEGKNYCKVVDKDGRVKKVEVNVGDNSSSYVIIRGNSLKEKDRVYLY